MTNTYKEKDLLYWYQIREVVMTILMEATIKSMIPIATPTHPMDDTTKIDEFNARVSMYNGGIRRLADNIAKVMDEMSVEKVADTLQRMVDSADGGESSDTE